MSTEATSGGPQRDVVFSIGSNLGNRLDYLSGAVSQLRATPGVRVKAVSSVYETAPVGLVEQPDFLNIVVIAESSVPGRELLARGAAIEAEFHRTREIHHGPRTVDVDIISISGEISDDPVLTLPHPRAHERAFVLVPWLECDPQAVLSGRGPVAELVDGLAVDSDAVVLRTDLRLDQ